MIHFGFMTVGPAGSDADMEAATMLHHPLQVSIASTSLQVELELSFSV